MVTAGTSKRMIPMSAAALMILMFAFGSIIVRSDTSAYRALDGRMKARVAVAAGFVGSYIEDTLRSERRHARTWLGADNSNRTAFDRVTASSGFEAAVLLGGDGKLEAVWPYKESLLGADFTAKYAHLDAALAGDTAVSNVVPSAAEGKPIVAFATPFQRESGRAVYSGAMSIHDSAMGARYLRSISTIPGSRVYLVDSASNLVASSEPVTEQSLAGTDHALVEALTGARTGHYSRGDADNFFASERVEGTPWRVVMTIPSESLYAPIAGLNRWVPWLVFASFGLLAGAVLWLLWRAGQRAVVLARSNDELQSKNAEVAALAEQLEELTLVDPLTGVHNRRGFEKRFEHQSQLARRQEECLQVLFIDINSMKTINDAHGHAAGDEALIRVADVLKQACREVDVVGRLGGDEFAIAWICNESPNVLPQRIEEMLALHATSLPYELTISMGASTFRPEEGQSLSEALEGADLQMYVHKKQRLAPARLHVAV